MQNVIQRRQSEAHAAREECAEGEATQSVPGDLAAEHEQDEHRKALRQPDCKLCPEHAEARRTKRRRKRGGGTKKANRPS